MCFISGCSVTPFRLDCRSELMFSHVMSHVCHVCVLVVPPAVKWSGAADRVCFRIMCDMKDVLSEKRKSGQGQKWEAPVTCSTLRFLFWRFLLEESNDQKPVKHVKGLEEVQNPPPLFVFPSIFNLPFIRQSLFFYYVFLRFKVTCHKALITQK